MSLTIAQKDLAAKNFATHYNYAKCMVGMMHALVINVPLDKAATVDLNEVRRFMKLANLTRRSITGEVTSCHSEEDYAQIVAPWLAVKCYYRIYYLESVLIHLTSGTHEVFRNGGHNYVRKTVRSYCKAGYITSHLKHAEITVKAPAALTHKITAGANLTAKYYLSEDCVKSVRHKIAEYGVAHWKKNQAHKNYRSKAAKADLSAYMARTELTLFDYFYQMRLKANYRDSDFLDFSVISSKDGVEFIDMLKAATDKYCGALEAAIVTQLKLRGLTL